MTLQKSSHPNYATASAAPIGGQAWGPNMWALIDKEMTLKECIVYCWAPPDEPFDGEEGSIWTLNYFFFNKERKRVAYFYIRGVPVMNHSPRTGMAKRSASGYESGANKRARFWLGDRAGNIKESALDEDDPTTWNDDDAADVGDESYDSYDDETDVEDEQSCKSPVRDMSEDIAATMEIE